MKGFYSSFVILYYMVLAKNVKMDPRIITFQILELCLWKGSILVEC
jgi:hypothetical protein